jgi:serine/threonine protein phosphatase 1
VVERQRSETSESLTIYAIGDVHGQYELLLLIYKKLNILLSKLNAGSSSLVIHLGDLIDRGLDSILCLKAALNWNHEGCESIVLPGNHEQMLMSFWDSFSNRQQITVQQKSLNFWLQNGGDSVCEELSVDDNEDIVEVIVALEKAGVPMMLKKLSAAPAAVRAGQYLFVHAGIPCKPNTAGWEFTHPDDVPGMDWRSENPNAPGFEERSSPLWVREPFLDNLVSWPDDVIVVHGHTITMEGPEIRHNRIGIDTGACMDGSLTMLEINCGKIRFHSLSKEQTQ